MPYLIIRAVSRLTIVCPRFVSSAMSCHSGFFFLGIKNNGISTANAIIPARSMP